MNTEREVLVSDLAEVKSEILQVQAELAICHYSQRNQHNHKLKQLRSEQREIESELALLNAQARAKATSDSLQFAMVFKEVTKKYVDEDTYARLLELTQKRMAEQCAQEP